VTLDDQVFIAALRDAHDVHARLPRPADVQRIAGIRRRRRHVAWVASSIVMAGVLLTGALAARAGDRRTTTGTVDVVDDPTQTTAAPSPTAPPSTVGAGTVTLSRMSESALGVVELDGRYVMLHGEGASRRLSISDDGVTWERRPVEGIGLASATSLTVAPGGRLVLAGYGRTRSWVGTSIDGGATWTRVDLPLPEPAADPYWERHISVDGVMTVDGVALAVGSASESPDLRGLATDQFGDDPGELQILGYDGPRVTVRPVGDEETFVVDVTPAGLRAVELFAGAQQAPEGRFLVVGGLSTPLVWRSDDWQHWTRTTPFAAGRVRDAVAGPAGVLVAIRDRQAGISSVYRTTDGQTWEEVADPPADDSLVLAADADRYWAFDGVTLVSSGDGVTWHIHPLPIASDAASWAFMLAAGPAGVVLAITDAPADGGPPVTTVLSSADGETWEVEPPIVAQAQASLVTDEELLVVTFE
jgi:hypothetical protein